MASGAFPTAPRRTQKSIGENPSGGVSLTPQLTIINFGDANNGRVGYLAKRTHWDTEWVMHIPSPERYVVYNADNLKERAEGSTPAVPWQELASARAVMNQPSKARTRRSSRLVAKPRESPAIRFSGPAMFGFTTLDAALAGGLNENRPPADHSMNRNHEQRSSQVRSSQVRVTVKVPANVGTTGAETQHRELTALRQDIARKSKLLSDIRAKRAAASQSDALEDAGIIPPSQEDDGADSEGRILPRGQDIHDDPAPRVDSDDTQDPMAISESEDEEYVDPPASRTSNASHRHISKTLDMAVVESSSDDDDVDDGEDPGTQGTLDFGRSASPPRVGGDSLATSNQSSPMLLAPKEPSGNHPAPSTRDLDPLVGTEMPFLCKTPGASKPVHPAQASRAVPHPYPCLTSLSDAIRNINDQSRLALGSCIHGASAFTRLAFSPSGRHLATYVPEDHKIVVYSLIDDAASSLWSQVLSSPIATDGPPVFLGFSPDESTVLACHGNHVLQLGLDGFADSFTTNAPIAAALAVDPCHFVTACSDGEVVVWVKKTSSWRGQPHDHLYVDGDDSGLRDIPLTTLALVPGHNFWVVGRSNDRIVVIDVLQCSVISTVTLPPDLATEPLSNAMTVFHPRSILGNEYQDLSPSSSGCAIFLALSSLSLDGLYIMRLCVVAKGSTPDRKAMQDSISMHRRLAFNQFGSPEDMHPRSFSSNYKYTAVPSRDGVHIVNHNTGVETARLHQPQQSSNTAETAATEAVAVAFNPRLPLLAISFKHGLIAVWTCAPG